MHKAVLMAAGRGTRISRAIDESCKCTLDVAGEPLIRHTVSMLLRHGIETHVVVGFRQETVREALAGLPVKFHENVFYSVTNSLASLWWARGELVGESLILGNADVFWEENILSVLLDETRDCIMLCDSSRVEQGDYLFNVQGGKVVAFGKGLDCHKANSEYVGLARIQGGFVAECRKQLESMIAAQRHGDWWEQILYDVVKTRPVWAVDIAGRFWAEVDFIEDYHRILNYVKDGKAEG